MKLIFFVILFFIPMRTFAYDLHKRLVETSAELNSHLPVQIDKSTKFKRVWIAEPEHLFGLQYDLAVSSSEIDRSMLHTKLSEQVTVKACSDMTLRELIDHGAKLRFDYFFQDGSLPESFFIEKKQCR